MAKVLWGSAAVLLIEVLVLAVFVLNAATTPMLLNPSERLTDEGVAMVMLCGEQPHRETVNRTAWQIVKPRWQLGIWTYHRQGSSCVVYYHLRGGD